MLSTRHKAQILARAGVCVPPCPSPPSLSPPSPPSPAQQQGHASAPNEATGKDQMQAQAEPGAFEAEWQREIDKLYVQYAAERAARSLRQAQEAEQLDRLRRSNGSQR